MSKTKLNGRQQKFVEEYVKCLVAGEAARKAGYKTPDVDGHRLLRNAKVKKAIQSYQVKSKKRSIATFEDRQEILTGIAKKAIKDGDKVKAIDVLNKMEGNYLNRVQIEEKTIKQDVKGVVDKLKDWGFQVVEPDSWNWNDEIFPN